MGMSVASTHLAAFGTPGFGSATPSVRTESYTNVSAGEVIVLALSGDSNSFHAFNYEIEVIQIGVVGACCFTDGTCSDEGEGICNNAGGT